VGKHQVLEIPVTSPVNETPGYGLRVGREIVKLDKPALIIGRAEACDIVLSSALVSRQHARVRVSPEGVSIEDLGSRNGVLVNGIPIEEATQLTHGDTILLGDEQLKLVLLHPEKRHTLREIRTQDTLVGETDPNSDEATRQGNLLEVLGGVVDKQLALGHGIEAERLLAKQLKLTLDHAKLGRANPSISERAANYGIKLAAATNNPEWIVYAISIFHCQGKVMPIALVDELYSLLRRVRGVPVEVVRAYLAELRSRERYFSPAERFALKRIEGLEHIVLL
jgi:pSer/pThr/pTyr-binding forkhead associated (FHA) protein